MGPKYTEGAIVQHLSKLRSRRLKDGKIVPPPLRRAAAGSNKGGSISSTQQNGVVDDLSSGGSDPEYGAQASRKPKRPITRRASASAKKRTKPSAQKISPKNEKACVDAPFLQFLPAKSETPTDTSSFAPESLSEDPEDSLSNEKEEFTGQNRFASPAIADIQKSEIFEKKSSSPAAKQKLRVYFKDRTTSMLSSESIEGQHSSTPASMGENSPPTPRPQANVDRFWNLGALQMTSDSSQIGTPSRVQDFSRSLSQYPMQSSPRQQPLNHSSATFQGALQSPDFFDPKTYAQHPAFQENPSPRYARHPTHSQSQVYARSQQYPQSLDYPQAPPFAPNGFFYSPEDHRSLGIEMNMSSPHGLPRLSPNANAINPQDLFINAGNASSRGFEDLVDYGDDPDAGTF